VNANFGALTGKQILGDIGQVIGNAGLVNLRKGTQGRRRVAGFLLPVAIGPVGIEKRIGVLDDLNTGKIVDIRLAREAAEVGLLARIRFNRFFKGLVGGDPKILAKGVVIAVDTNSSGGTNKSAEAIVADEIGTIKLVVADSRANVHDPAAIVGRADKRAEFRHDFANVQVQKAIFDVVG